MSTDPLFSFQLPRGLLRAMSLFQADTDRPNLACTSFEIQKTVGGHHELTLVSIDGRRLASYQTEILQDTLWGELPDALQIVVDLEGCNKLPKVKLADVVTCEVFGDHVEFVADKLRYTTPRLDAQDEGVKFPEWRSLIPARAPERVDQIAVNHELLADFGRAAKFILGDKGYALALRTFGDGAPISVQFMGQREFYGIIMPLRTENPEAFPDWLKSKKELAADKQKPASETDPKTRPLSGMQKLIESGAVERITISTPASGRSVVIDKDGIHAKGSTNEGMEGAQ